MATLTALVVAKSGGRNHQRNSSSILGCSDHLSHRRFDAPLLTGHVDVSHAEEAGGDVEHIVPQGEEARVRHQRFDVHVRFWMGQQLHHVRECRGYDINGDDSS